ncbi:helix-turn-helix domain-containing protein [Virgibacillus dokdonensis]|uniref:Helix-turn-helix domain protein n=1 Tax=Virgibacillus dokdonensis TaxID=302167 RepID=A0A2K9J3R6_9BACI|nr:helix-turn-helix transcriptional regulator [Virgibacillus dokdonensis]AUJ26587.1 Helix-turn-helix domain protein [Virgibacillus dokdonensis]
MNVNKLKGKIVENEMNIRELAEKIGVDRSTLYRKLNNKGDTLSIKEANRIVYVLNLTKEEATAIFFNIDVASCAKKESEKGVECF